MTGFGYAQAEMLTAEAKPERAELLRAADRRRAVSYNPSTTLLPGPTRALGGLRSTPERSSPALLRYTRGSSTSGPGSEAYVCQVKPCQVKVRPAGGSSPSSSSTWTSGWPRARERAFMERLCSDSLKRSIPALRRFAGSARRPRNSCSASRFPLSASMVACRSEISPSLRSSSRSRRATCRPEPSLRRRRSLTSSSRSLMRSFNPAHSRSRASMCPSPASFEARASSAARRKAVISSYNSLMWLSFIVSRAVKSSGSVICPRPLPVLSSSPSGRCSRPLWPSKPLSPLLGSLRFRGRLFRRLPALYRLARFAGGTPFRLDLLPLLSRHLLRLLARLLLVVFPVLFRFLRGFGEARDLADLCQDLLWFWSLADPGVGDSAVGSDDEEGPTGVVALFAVFLQEPPLATGNLGVVVEHVGLQPRSPGEVARLRRLRHADGDHRAGSEVDLFLSLGQRLEVSDILLITGPVEGDHDRPPHGPHAQPELPPLGAR